MSRPAVTVGSGVPPAVSVTRGLLALTIDGVARFVVTSEQTVVETYRILTEAGDLLLTEASDYLITE